MCHFTYKENSLFNIPSNGLLMLVRNHKKSSAIGPCIALYTVFAGV